MASNSPTSGEMIPAFIQYNGQWQQDHNYVNYQVDGILLPCNVNFQMLVAIIHNQLRIKPETQKVEIRYQVKTGWMPILIKDDMSLSFYLEIRKKEKDYTVMPLCVTCENIDASECQTLLPVVETNGNLEIGGEQSRNTLPPVVETKANLEIGGEQMTISTTNRELLNEGESDSDSDSDMFHYVSCLASHKVDEITSKLKERADLQSMEEEGIIRDPKYFNIQQGNVFKDLLTLKSAMNFYAVKKSMQFKPKRTCPTRYVLVCKNENCSWTMRANRLRSTKMFKIKKLEEEHTCSLEARLECQNQITSTVVGNLIKKKFLNSKTIYTPTDIMREMQEEHGIKLSYSKACKSKKWALESIRGNPKAAYGLIPGYLHELTTANPGTVTELKTDGDGRFIYVFISLNASRHGWQHCHPIVVVDGIFLTGPYGGTLMTASTQDAAGNIFILAFAIVDSENDASWLWFFEQLKISLGLREGMCIVSDRHESIEKAAKIIYPEASHCLCIFHLVNDLKSNFKNNQPAVKELFIKAANSYSLAQFTKLMEEIDELDNRVKPYLADIGFERWSRVHSVENRWSTMTSNVAESVNSTIKSAKDLPIVSLMEYMRSLIQNWTNKHKLEALSTMTRMSKKHEDKLHQNMSYSHELQVDEAGNCIFTVTYLNKKYRVDMQKKRCTCNRFQIDDIPCAHALAVIRDRFMDPYEYCSVYYTKEKYVAAYEETVYPVPNQEAWDTPKNVANQIVLPPIGRAKVGRPKKQRIQSNWEVQLQGQTKVRCSQCGQNGHNKRTCKNMSLVTFTQNDAST